MNISKAIRKQNKSYKHFLLSMCFIFFILPCALYFSGQYRNVFYIIFLSFIEILILLCTVSKIRNCNLKVDCDGIKLKIEYGLRKKSLVITCEKVVFVHTEDLSGGDFNIVILTVSKFRNDYIKAIDKKFLEGHPFAAFHYYNIKKMNPEEQYFYIIIKSGGYNKYKLLDTMYKNCVYALYTDEALNKIIEYRSGKP